METRVGSYLVIRRYPAPHGMQFFGSFQSLQLARQAARKWAKEESNVAYTIVCVIDHEMFVDGGIGGTDGGR